MGLRSLLYLMACGWSTQFVVTRKGLSLDFSGPADNHRWYPCKGIMYNGPARITNLQLGADRQEQ
jgi:hypothetical protein